MRGNLNRAGVIIIGGGASGLAAACCLTKMNIPFLIIDKNEKLGKKLYATGNGRCNLLNLAPLSELEKSYFGDTGFALRVLENMDALRVKAWLESLGLVIFKEDMQRCYPASLRSDSVVSCLENGLRGEILLGTKALSFSKVEDGFLVHSDKGDFFAERLIIASGAKAQKKLGADSDILDSLRPLSFSFAPFKPALCPLETEKSALGGLSGTRCMALASLVRQERGEKRERRLLSTSGEVLFSDTGVSGIAIMQLARDAREGDILSLDFSPLLGNFLPYGRLTEPVDAQKSYEYCLNSLKKRSKYMNDVLLGLFPKKLENKLRAESLEKTAKNICDFRLKIRGSRGFDFAQVCAGGVRTEGINPSTLESHVKGLYILGEALNVDGDCGGFNLLFAFATGLLCAENIWKEYGLK